MMDMATQVDLESPAGIATDAGTCGRRSFLARLGVAGCSIGLSTRALRAAGVEAQDAPAPPALGNPAIPHITSTDKGTIKLYSSWPLSGPYEQLGGDAVEAVKMCLEDFGNAAGGYAITYIALDDGVAANNGGWEAGKESDNANKVINDPAAMVYIGTLDSGAAKIAIPILNEASMPMISTGATYPGLTKAIEGVTEAGEPDRYYPTGERTFMRVCPADDIQGSAAAAWALNGLGAKRAYVVHDQSLYGKGVAIVFNRAFVEGGGEVIGMEGYDPKAYDYQALMASIASKAPDVVFCGANAIGNSAKLLQDMRSLMDDDVAFLATDGVNIEAFVQEAAEAGEGAYLTLAGQTPEELLALGGPGAEFVTRITERLGHVPNSYTVYAYEAALVALQAIDRAGVNDRTAILDAMLATQDFASLLGGSWAFTDTGDTDYAAIGLYQVVDGTLTFRETIASVAR